MERDFNRTEARGGRIFVCGDKTAQLRATRSDEAPQRVDTQQAIRIRRQPSFGDQLPDWLKVQIGNNKKEGKIGSKFNLSIDWNAKWDSAERWLLRTSAAILSFVIIYTIIVTFLKMETDRKIEQVEEVKEHTSKQIQLAETDIQKLNNKTVDYKTTTENLKSYSDEVQTQLRTKNVIPLLLTRIMNVIPKGVTITAIENTKDTHVVINAQSEDYDLLGFFKGSLIVDGILEPGSVVSTSGIKQNGIVKIVIEGDLP